MTWVTCQRNNPEARLRLFCFPFAGGIAVYNSWFDEFPPDVQRATELCSILLPGHEPNRKGTLVSTLPPLIDVLLPDIMAHQSIPFVFFGHSMGALVSFELARRLRREGVATPVHMIVSGHRAPQLRDTIVPIHRLPYTAFQQKLLELGGTPDAVLQDSELLDLLIPALRADFSVCETYQYTAEEPLGCSITAFGGNNDPRVTREELSAWEAQAQGPFTVRMFPGDHFFLQNAQTLVVRIVADDLKQVLRRLTSRADL